ncbi:MAG: thiamine diphosphokinase [Lachnospiraceae bacterium]|nr:thiamine diphosphokinase [Lachnospiraceae bacterium]
MRRCVIVGNAAIADYARVREYLKPDDFIICCDGGLKHTKDLLVSPDLIVGDFDSIEKPKTDIETIVLPREKDDTDTFYAAKEAYTKGFRDFLLVGVFGGRLDHTFGNISLMLWLYNRECRCLAIDDQSEMQIVGKDAVYIDDTYSFFSLLCIDGPALGISISGAKFPLDNGAITSEYQYGISNEVLPGATATVSVENGVLFLVKTME